MANADTKTVIYLSLENLMLSRRLHHAQTQDKVLIFKNALGLIGIIQETIDSKI